MMLPNIRHMYSADVVARNLDVEEIEFAIRYIDEVVKTNGDIQSIRFSSRFDLEVLGIGYYNDRCKTTAYFSIYEAVAVKNRLLMALKKKGSFKWKKI